MASPRFGRGLRPLWDLEPGGTFLNHGSYGACPKAVLGAQARFRAELEAQPDLFFRERVAVGNPDSALRAAAVRLAGWVKAPASSIAFVENATSGVQAALRSVSLRPGDVVLLNDHTYNAVRLMVQARCAETGARMKVVTLPWPATEDGIVAAFEAALDEPVRLAIVDHITSPTALAMPLARIVPRLREAGAQVIVDGAHAVGQLALDVPAVGADWYASNAHKWLYAPRGCAFLCAAEAVAPATKPLVVSHYVETGFPHSFDWVGTRDCTPWLAVPAAIEFFEGLDPVALRAHNAALLDVAQSLLVPLGARPIAEPSLNASMRAFELPTASPVTREVAQAFVRATWHAHRIQVMATELHGRLLLRVSGQAYVEEEDLAALATALARGGWPDRVPR